MVTKAKMYQHVGIPCFPTNTFLLFIMCYWMQLLLNDRMISNATVTHTVLCTYIIFLHLQADIDAGTSLLAWLPWCRPCGKERRWSWKMFHHGERHEMCEMLMISDGICWKLNENDGYSAMRSHWQLIISCILHLFMYHEVCPQQAREKICSFPWKNLWWQSWCEVFDVGQSLHMPSPLRYPVPSNTIQYHPIPSNTIQYHPIPNTTRWILATHCRFFVG